MDILCIWKQRKRHSLNKKEGFYYVLFSRNLWSICKTGKTGGCWPEISIYHWNRISGAFSRFLSGERWAGKGRAHSSPWETGSCRGQLRWKKGCPKRFLYAWRKRNGQPFWMYVGYVPWCSFDRDTGRLCFGWVLLVKQAWSELLPLQGFWEMRAGCTYR